MIILDGNTQVLQAVLAGAVNSDQPEFQATYGQLDAAGLDTYATNHGELNSTTDVALVSGVSAKQIGIKSITVFNRDDAQVTITFKKDISATDRFLYRVVLEVNESVHYESARGWYVSSANGSEKSAETVVHTGHVTGTTDLTLVVAAITGQTALTSGLVSTDEVLVSDGGVIKRMDISVLEEYLSTNLTGLAFGIQFFIATGANATYIVDQFASFAYTIVDAVAETASGTITLEVNIDTVAVTGISAMAITSTESTDTASATNAVAAGATVDFIFTANSSALGLSVKLNCTRD